MVMSTKKGREHQNSFIYSMHKSLIFQWGKKRYSQSQMSKTQFYWNLKRTNRKFWEYKDKQWREQLNLPHERYTLYWGRENELHQTQHKQAQKLLTNANAMIVYHSWCFYFTSFRFATQSLPGNVLFCIWFLWNWEYWKANTLRQTYYSVYCHDRVKIIRLAP